METILVLNPTNKPLYVISESDTSWLSTIRNDVMLETGNNGCVSDKEILFIHICENLLGMIAAHADSTLYAGNDKSTDIFRDSEKKFRWKEIKYDNLKLDGIEIEIEVEESKINPNKITSIQYILQIQTTKNSRY